MTSLKRRLSGTRTFAATYNQQQQQPREETGFSSPADGGDIKNTNSLTYSNSNSQQQQQQQSTVTSTSTLAGPLPSPLFPTSSIGGQPPKIKRFVPATSLDVTLKVQSRQEEEAAAVDQERNEEEEKETQPQTTTQIASLYQKLQELQPVIKPRDTLTQRLNIPLLRRVASFVGSSFSELKPFASMNRATRSACTHCVEDVTIVPNETSLESISNHGALDSFTQYLKRGDRGHHAKKFAIIDPRFVYTLDASVLGPSLCLPDIVRTISMMPKLRHVDVRGVALREYAGSAGDNFLNDVARLCPLLESLRVGLTIAKGWKKGWWLPIQNSLKEFVIGSRREDSEFLSSSSSSTSALVTPNNQFQLPYIDDLLLLARSTPLQTLKIWPALAFPQLHQILFPVNTGAGSQFVNVLHLSVTVGTTNANLLFTPEADAVLNRERELLASLGAINAGDQQLHSGKGGTGSKQSQGGSAAAQSTRGGNKPNQAQAALEEANQRIMYPSLISFTLADVNTKPDLISDLMQRLGQVAPDVRHWNITNTHRQGPTALAVQTAASQQRTRRPHAPNM